MSLNIKRTHSKNQDFINLVKELDAFLSVKNGESDAFYSQFNRLENLKYVIVLYQDEKPIGCGALKKFDTTSVEIKRMYISENYQGKQLGQSILSALENWAKELGYTRCVLETGTMLPEAIRFYEKNNYHRIPNYPPYVGVAESVCFEKKIA